MNSFNILEGKNIFFCGIGGIGMSAIASLLFDCKNNRLKVFGSNNYSNDNVLRLQNKGLEVFIGHDENNITEDIDFFVYTDAVSKNNVELLKAEKLKLKMFSRGEFLAEISNAFSHNINITGTHGKTTTSGIIGHMFDFANKSPFIVCGGLMKNYNNNYKAGNSEFFIKEADESNDSFLRLKTDTAVITSIEEDHLENHNNIEKIYDKFVLFCQNANNIVVCKEYKYCRKIIKNFSNKKKVISYGFKDTANVYAKNIRFDKQFITFDVFYNGKLFLKSVKIYMFGEHNILNSLATICCGIIYGIHKLAVKRSFLKFKGISNRFDILGTKHNNLIINDYAHNPRKIRSAIASAVHLKKQNGKYKDYKVVVFFEPHKHSRVKFLMEDFAKSFKFINKLYILDIYKSYEENPEIVCKEFFGQKIHDVSKIDVCLIDTDKDKITKEISQLSNNIILFLSAGNYNLANNICCVS